MSSNDLHPDFAMPIKSARRTVKVRRLSTFRVGVFKVAGRRQLCIIRNISEGGARLYLYSSVMIGQRVSIELRPDQHADGVVMWREHGSVGLQFDSKIDLDTFFVTKYSSSLMQRSRLPRVEVDRFGELRSGALRFPVNTCDISQGGIRVKIDTDLKVGAGIVLTLEDFYPVQGTVRWSRSGTAGIALNKLLPFDDLVSWLEANNR